MRSKSSVLLFKYKVNCGYLALNYIHKKIVQANNENFLEVSVKIVDDFLQLFFFA